jgi:hypothetical protein
VVRAAGSSAQTPATIRPPQPLPSTQAAADRFSPLHAGSPAAAPDLRTRTSQPWIPRTSPSTLAGVTLPAEPEEPAAAADLAAGFDAFADQLRGQIASAGPPASEHAIHFCLALGLQSAWRLPPGSLVFEQPSKNRTRIDLWIGSPYDLAIEIKYLRLSGSGSAPALPMHYGQVLADLNKVAQARCRTRLVILVADDRYLSYLHRSGQGLLPFNIGAATVISKSSLDRLPATARLKAQGHGEWTTLRAALTWSAQARGSHLFAWTVSPE